MPAKTIPAHLMNDRYWAPTIFLFSNHYKLQSTFNTRYFDLDDMIIDIPKLKKLAAPWSHSEKIMLSLALHLFNEKHKFNLSDLDYIGAENLDLALKAIRMRFRG